MLKSSQKYYGYNDDSYMKNRSSYKPKSKTTVNQYSQNAIRSKQLQVVKSWPVYIVVTREFYGIYDDYSKALIDTVGLGEVHICQKNSVLQADADIDKYHDYFFGIVGHPRKINIKNRMIKLT